jgi:hypothetical protein
MKNSTFKPIIIALMAASVTMGNVYADDDQDKAPNISDKKAEHTERAQAVGNVALARQLAAYAQAHQDALGLVVAARMTQDNPTQEFQGTKEGGTKEADVTDPLSTVDGILNQAREFSGGRAEIVAMIDETAKRGGSKGATGGPVRHVDRVRAGATDMYRIKFDGLEEARVIVIGDGTDLDCYVDDASGHRVTSDTDSTQTCALSWTPAWTGNYLIKMASFKIQ